MNIQKPFRVALFCLLIFSLLILSVLTFPSRSAAEGVPFSLPAAVAPVTDWRNKVDAGVLTKATFGQTEFIVYLTQQADLSGAAALDTKEEKGRYVYEQLTATARATQAPVKQALSLLGAQHRAFWVTNSIWAKGGLAVVQAMAMRPEVAYVYPVGTGALKLPPQESGPNAADLFTADPNPELNLTQVKTNDVWNMGILGQGVVVASADTGVFWEHAALKGKYRGWNGSTANHNYNWHDAIHNPNPYCPADSPQPCDDDELLGGGHGSHTTGTMLGDDGGNNRVGMAPEAKWIACRNLNNGVGAVPTYMECMEWFIAPTDISNQNPDPTKAPHVINNSWGCVEGCPQPLLQNTLQASRAAGIFYAVSAGNDGSECNTLQFPLARYPEAFTVGATDHRNDLIASFSSRGNVLGDPNNIMGLTKPNITAPGVGVRSCQRDGSYASLSGTSMAGPHVAGLVALLISANPRLAGKVDRLEDIIENTAVRKTSTEGCGGDTNQTIPNNTYGWGRINALAATLDALPPDAVNDGATTQQGAPVVINALANDTDPDNDALTISAAGPAANGNVTNNGDGTLTYTPNSGFSGNDSFTYTVCAPEGCAIASDTATVTVAVSSANGLVNYALSALGALATSSTTYVNPGYPASSAIDGEHQGLNWGNNGGWNDNTRDVWPDSLEVAFSNNLPKTISEIRVYTVQNDFRNPVEPTALTPADLYGILDFQVQAWDGAAWVTVPGGNVTGNDRALRVFTFPAITTTKLRVLVTGGRSNWSRIVEIEAFGAASQ